MHTIFHDLRFALRMLSKSPGYTIVVLFTLALAIGANTAIFSAVHSVLLRPLPFHEPDRLLVVLENQPEFGDMPVSYLNYVDYRDGNTSFSRLGAMTRLPVNLTGNDAPEQLIADLYSDELLPVLGVEPALGRNFLPEEDAPGGPKAAILTHGLWTRKFAADPAIVGRTIELDGAPWTVVGVMPASYHFIFDGTDIIVPLGTRADTFHFRDRKVRTGIFLFGRLEPDVTPEQAAADLLAIGEGIAGRFADNFATCRPKLTALREAVTGDHRPGLLLLMGAVICVLLIAIANVANLMLERAMTRQREMGIRAALGASRWRLVRPLLVESVLLAITAAGLGLLLALWGVDLLTAIRPKAGFDMFGPIVVDGPVLVFTLGVAVATGLLFGVLPAVYASRQDLAQALKDADLHATAGGRHLRARNILVVAEVALALALLVTAVLAIRGLARMQGVDLGFTSEGVVHARIMLTPERFTKIAESRQFWSEVRRRVAEVPGVESVAISAGVPIYGGPRDLIDHVGQPVGLATSHLAVSYIADEHYIPTLKIPLLAGRAFGPQDGPGTTPVLIIDSTLAEAMFPGQDPIGQRLADRLSEQPSIEIVGVVGHVHDEHPDAPPSAPFQMYYAIDQLPQAAEALLDHMAVVVRTRGGDPYAIVPQLRAAVAAVDAKLALHGVVTFPDAQAELLGPRRYTISLLGGFAGLALLLAGVGLYAVMARTVVQRTHELGVRLALGAQPRAIVTLVVGQGMTLVAVGVALGLPGAYVLTRLMPSTVSKHISPTDPLTYSAVVVILVLVGLVATYLPARRATHIDPMVALRHE